MHAGDGAQQLLGLCLGFGTGIAGLDCLREPVGPGAVGLGARLHGADGGAHRLPLVGTQGRTGHPAQGVVVQIGCACDLGKVGRCIVVQAPSSRFTGHAPDPIALFGLQQLPPAPTQLGRRFLRGRTGQAHQGQRGQLALRGVGCALG